MPNNFTTAHDILADLHGKLDKSKRIGDKLTARCPAHEDKTPSLSVKIGDNDCVILKCFAGCTTEEVVDALGWTMRDLFASDANRPPVSSSRRVYVLDPSKLPGVPIHSQRGGVQTIGTFPMAWTCSTPCAAPCGRTRRATLATKRTRRN